MEQLILLLGKGGPGDDARAGEYRTATYFFRDRPNDVKTTPFVGEAIVKLSGERFSHVHIVGTAGSIWDVLLKRAGDPLDDAIYQDLIDLSDLETAGPEALAFPGKLKPRIESVLSDYLNTQVSAHLMPLGRNDTEFWAMLRLLAGLDIRSGRVSIDVTHGLRSAPIFLLLALVYLRATHDDLSLGSVYYGAIALRDQFGDKTPIFDLRSMVELLDWIDAAKAFGRHGDADPIAHLLAEEDASLEAVADRARYVSQVLQLNTLSDIEANTAKLIRYVEEAEQAPVPFQLVAPKLLEMPRAVAGQSAWEAKLTVARQHLDSYRAGLAVLAAWQAVLERFAALYGLSNTQDHYKALANIACDHTLSFYYQIGLGELPKKLSRLRTFRNGIAHADQSGRTSDFQPPEVYHHFPEQLEYLEMHLASPKLSDLPAHADRSGYES